MADKKDEETFPESNPYAWTEDSDVSIDEFLKKVCVRYLRAPEDVSA